jgi:hypothetical protein
MQSEQEQAAEELRRQVDFIIDPRKCVHIKLPSELHAEMRVFGLRKKLSLQEMLVEFCQLVVDGDAAIQRKMDDLAKRKKEKRIKKLTEKDSEDIYDYIAKQAEREP